jgi:hypothetical protein
VTKDDYLHGLWWRPDSSDERVPGYLAPDGNRWRLYVSGSMSKKALLGGGESLPAIHGTLSDGRTITLHDAACVSHNVNFGGSGLHYQEWSTGSYFERAHAHGRDVPVHRIWLELPEAANWLQLRPDADGAEWTLSAATVKLAEIALPGAVLRLRSVPQVDRPSRAAATVRCVAQITIELGEPMPLSDLMRRFVHPLRDLVAFATHGFVDIGSIRLDLGSGPECVYHVHHYTPPASPDREERPEYMLLRPGADGDLGDLVARWLALYPEHRMAITLLLLTRYAELGFGEVMLSTAIMSGELLHDAVIGTRIPRKDRRPEIARIINALDDPDLKTYARGRLQGGQKGFARQMEELAALAPQTLAAVDAIVPKFVATLVSARGKNVSHGAEWDAISGPELYCLSRGLRWIIADVVLQEMDYSSDESAAMINRSRKFHEDLGNMAIMWAHRPEPPTKKRRSTRTS